MSSPHSAAKLATRTAPGRSILSWLTFDRFLLSVVLLIVFVAAANMGTQSDTWWLLRTGELIMRTGQIPTTDIYSSTVRGGYWPNHEWLAEVLFYACYARGGLPLLFLGCAGLTAAAWYGMIWLGGGPGSVRAVALLIGVASQALIWSVRPHLFSLALLVLLLVLASARRFHWLYPLVFLFWANLHAGVAFGGVMLVVVFLVAFIRDAARWYTIGREISLPSEGLTVRSISRALVCSESAHWLLVLVASGLATLVN